MGVTDIVLFKIAKMLRRWVPMMKQEMGEGIVGMVAQLELKASSPPQLMWHSLGSSLSSRFGPLDVQPLAPSTAISDLHEGVDIPRQELLAVINYLGYLNACH